MRGDEMIVVFDCCVWRGGRRGGGCGGGGNMVRMYQAMDTPSDVFVVTMSRRRGGMGSVRLLKSCRLTGLVFAGKQTWLGRKTGNEGQVGSTYSRIRTQRQLALPE